MDKIINGYWNKEETAMENTVDDDNGVVPEIGDESQVRPGYYLYLKRKYVLGHVYLWKAERPIVKKKASFRR